MNSRQQGLAMVELVLLLPIMVIVMFGTIEFARALFQEQALSKAALGGLRYMTRAYNAVNDDCTPNGFAWVVSESRAKNLTYLGGGDSPIIPDMAKSDVQFSVVKRSVAAPLGDVCVIQIQISVPFKSLFGDKMVPFTNISPPTLNAALEGVYVGD